MAPPVQENLTEEEDEAMEQLLRAETLTVADEAAAEAINEIMSICLEGSEEETVGKCLDHEMITMADEVEAEAIKALKDINLNETEEETLEKYLDHLVSTKDDAFKAIRELLEIIFDDALSASLQPLETETVMMTVTDEAVAEATHELITICMHKSEEEPVEKHLDHPVSTNDDAAKAIRELVEILYDHALLASVQPLGRNLWKQLDNLVSNREDKTRITSELLEIQLDQDVPAKENYVAQGEAAIDEHINLDNTEPYDDRSFGNEIMRDWMTLATKSLKDLLGIPLEDTEEDPEKKPEDEPLKKDVISVLEAEAQPEAAKDTVTIYLDETETTENQLLRNEIMRDWMTLATKSLKDLLRIPWRTFEEDPEKEPEDEPLGEEEGLKRQQVKRTQERFFWTELH
ncbi:hypothetical protein MHYP_G00238750 [Metynnis hypsauchen]